MNKETLNKARNASVRSMLQRDWSTWIEYDNEEIAGEWASILIADGFTVKIAGNARFIRVY